MKLSELVTARVSPDLQQQIKDDVAKRRAGGLRVNEADIVREALVEKLARSKAVAPATAPQEVAA